MAETKTGTVLYDRVAFVTGRDERRRPMVSYADKGQEVEFPASEYDRLAAFDPPAVGSQSDLAKQEAETSPPGTPTPSATDAELEALKADDLISYLEAHPDEVDRIENLEGTWLKGKDKDTGEPAPRATVQKALDAVRSTQT